MQTLVACCLRQREAGKAADVEAGWNMQTQLFSQGSLFGVTQRENIVLVWDGWSTLYCYWTSILPITPELEKNRT